MFEGHLCLDVGPDSVSFSSPVSLVENILTRLRTYEVATNEQIVQQVEMPIIEKRGLAF